MSQLKNAVIHVPNNGNFTIKVDTNGLNDFEILDALETLKVQFEKRIFIEAKAKVGDNPLVIANWIHEQKRKIINPKVKVTIK